MNFWIPVLASIAIGHIGWHAHGAPGAALYGGAAGLVATLWVVLKEEA